MHALYKPHSNVFVAHLFFVPFSLTLSLSLYLSSNSYSLLLRLSKCSKLKFIVSWMSECLFRLFSWVTFFPSALLFKWMSIKILSKNFLSMSTEFESCLGMLSA